MSDKAFKADYQIIGNIEKGTCQNTTKMKHQLAKSKQLKT